MVAAPESIELLRARGVRLAPGLTAPEISAIESRFGFEFNPDHRDFLSIAAPQGEGWIDWRGDDRAIQEALSRPAEGVMFDVEENDFWPRSWGEAPPSLPNRLRRAYEQIATWPTLVPLYGHRFVPASPAGRNAPVFSVWQTDVIVYGRDVLDYVQREFGAGRAAHSVDGVDPRICPPWSLLAFGLDDEI
ncbi:hypothetical protein ACFVU2_07115 [Leifsonia sp. NPDC058194]|uniref:hypothetical protein n=1 Tax=Leifsonia sp. NPDC058194 TaxID=3346374 RepID=UPI0036D76ACA